MSISAKDIQQLRSETGVGIMDCKKALEEAKGVFGKAREVLKKKGALMAAKKTQRETCQGLVESYIHGNGKIGVLIEVNCETDFVARNQNFAEFVHDLAMQIASMNPKNVESLLKQEFIKDPSLTIKEYLTQRIAQIGENIQIKRFIRYELGEK